MNNSNRLRIPCSAGFLICFSLCLGVTQAFGDRAVIPLDGQWEIAEGSMGAVPAQFEHRVPVPGLVDEARPPFAEVGQKSPRREAFWYRRTFQVKGEVPAVAVLKLHKAAYGSRVFLNGVSAGRAPAQLHAGLLRCAAGLARQWGRERTGRPRRGHARGPAAHRAVGLGFRESALYPGPVRFGRVDSVRDAEHCPRAGRARDCQPNHSRAGGRAECRPEDQRAIALQGARGALRQARRRGQLGADHARRPTPSRP